MDLMAGRMVYPHGDHRCATRLRKSPNKAYEQARRRGLSIADSEARLRAYETRWNIWVNGMLP